MSGMTGKTELRQRLVPLWTAYADDYINLLTWSPTGQLLACASADGGVAVYSVDKGRLLWRHSAHGLGTTALDWSPDGKKLASGGQDNSIMIWEPVTGEPSACWKVGRNWVEKLAWSSDGMLASIAGKELKLWDEWGSLKQTFDPVNSTLTGLAWMCDDDIVTSCYGQVNCWQPGKVEPVRNYSWKGSLLSLAESPDGEWIAAGSQEGIVMLWSTSSGKSCQMSGYSSKVRHLSWSHDGQLFATGAGEDILIWDCSGEGPEGTEPDYLPVHLGTITALSFSPVSKWIASGAEDCSVFLYDAERRQKLAILVDDQAVSALCWHPEGEYLAAGYANGTVKLLQLVGHGTAERSQI
ncbi:TPA: WD40 repeat domain-containing protein [Klebsiella variicola]|nr:WD40 repeat domain-containing protein [Klebsiella variicola]